MQLADIDMEQFFFVKMSEVLSHFNKVNGTNETKRAITLALATIDNMAIS